MEEQWHVSQPHLSPHSFNSRGFQSLCQPEDYSPSRGHTTHLVVRQSCGEMKLVRVSGSNFHLHTRDDGEEEEGGEDHCPRH